MMDFGCIPKNIKNKVVNNTLLIEPEKMIVLENEGKYGAVDIKGRMLIPVAFDGIYSVINAGETMYYLLYNEQEYSAMEYIDLIKRQLGIYPEEENNQNNEQENTNTVDDNVDTNNVENDVQNTTSQEQQNGENVSSIESTDTPENTENNAE